MDSRTFAILLFAAAIVCGPTRAGESARADFYEKRIRPLFSDHCYECHSASAKKVKAGLRLDTAEGIRKGGESGALLVAGDPEKSLLVKAIRHTDADLQMPPKTKLAESAIADVVQWVRDGAPLPESVASASQVDPIAAARTNWAFSAPADPPVPVLRADAWSRSPVDRFLQARLTGFKPAPLADKRTLIRRATYDLTGLPPTPEEIEVFLNDVSTNAFPKLVDRLLASPAYGEKWARHWLDVVRYTDSFDSRGIGGDADVPEAWRYRDWVVNALNKDMPYDQFVRAQIAGDILATNTPGRFDPDLLVATGVYVIGEWGGGDADKEKMLTDIVDDQIDVTGRGFLGLTLACARCHDHKFDPIPTADYYGLAGIFFSSHILPNPGAKTAGSPVLRLPLVSPAEIEARAQREKRVAELEPAIATQTGVTVLRNSSRGNFSQPALSELHGDVDLPGVVANSSDAAINYLTITLPAHAVAIHPSPEKRAAAVWVSPKTGTVAVRGRVADADAQCGNGVEWRLCRGTNTVAKGEIDNGGQQTIPATYVSVTTGELLSLSVGPRGKDHACDTTVIELKINQPGTTNTWQLPNDVVMDLGAHANTRAWYFVSSTEAGITNLDSKLRPEEEEQLRAQRAELAALRKALQAKMPVAHGLQEGGTPQSAYAGFADRPILVRGKYDRPGEKVPRHFPRVLAGERSISIASNRSGRVELADWIASKDNPLTARVLVNRLWQHHFGAGIVRTPNNFGRLGTPPTHPELLDWLAHRFVESGWSIKAMHRLLMNTAAYQQTASNRESVARDPDNTLFGRATRRRLEAEDIRDAMLFVSGRLDSARGGPSINDLNTRRRTLYVMTVRSDKSNFRSLFDAPDAQTIAESRITSTVAPQALFLLNNTFVLEQAKALAQRIIGASKPLDDDRIERLYTMLYGRAPTDDERRLGRAAVADGAAESWERYCQVLLCANEFVYVD